MRSHEKVKVRVVAVDGKPPEGEFKQGDEFYMIRKEWEELDENELGKYMIVGNPYGDEMAILYLKEIEGKIEDERGEYIVLGGEDDEHGHLA